MGQQYPHIGGLIMGHGDDHGLVIPPRLPPIQVVVLAVKEQDQVLDTARRLGDELTRAGVRVRVDLRTDQGFGRRVTDWELKGVPVRVEIGPRDVANGEVNVVRRDTREKVSVSVDQAAATAAQLLNTVQAALYENGVRRLTLRMVETESLEEAREAGRSGFARIPWRILGVEASVWPCPVEKR